MKNPEFALNAMFLIVTVILYLVGGAALGSFAGGVLYIAWKLVMLGPPLVKFITVIGGFVGVLMWLWEVFT